MPYSLLDMLYQSRQPYGAPGYGFMQPSLGSDHVMGGDRSEQTNYGNAPAPGGVMQPDGQTGGPPDSPNPCDPPQTSAPYRRDVVGPQRGYNSMGRLGLNLMMGNRRY